MSSTEKVLRAKIQLIDNYTAPMRKAISQTKTFQAAAKAVKPIVLKVKDMASKIINKVKAQIDKFKNTKFGQFILKAKDMATKVIKKVTILIKSFASKVWNATIAIKDKASSILSNIKSKLTSLAGGITIGVAVKESVGGAMQLQQDQTTIRHFMGVGNSGKSSSELDKMANQYSSWLTNNANLTPFTNAEVMAGGAKALTATGGNVAKAQEMVKRAEDMAGLMGKPLEQAIDALMDVELGQYARLTEFGLSMEGGEKGDKPEDVLKEIDRRFGGGASKLSESAKGKMSTMTGKLSASLSQVGTVFLEPLANSFDRVSGLIDNFTPKLVEVAEKAKETFGAFMQSEQANQYMQIFKTVGSVVFDAIGKVIETCRPFVEKVFNFIASKSPEISNIIEGLGAIWDMVWSTVGPLLETAWAIVEPILSWLIDKLSELSDFIQKVGDWWTDMVDKIKNNPIVAKVSQVWDKVTGKSEGRNAFGSGRIARDGTLRTLHEGEKVLTKREADAYLKGQNNQGVNITVNGLTVREEADIDKIATAFVRKIKEAQLGYSGVMA